MNRSLKLTWTHIRSGLSKVFLGNKSCTCIGAIITPEPPGDGMMNAGTGAPVTAPGNGLLLGRPLPRFTIKITVKITGL